MALVECPECHEKVSKLAKSCPHCGVPGWKLRGLTEGEPEKPSYWWQHWWQEGGGAVLVAIATLVFFIWVLVKFLSTD